MSDKPKFPRSKAMEVARQIHTRLSPHCERVIFAGSLRRQRDQVGDIEVLYIPKFSSRRVGLFETDVERINDVDLLFKLWIEEGFITQRISAAGCTTWGPKNKLARHSGGIPVDLFQATHENWFNYLVCRTGSADNNVRIASAAQDKGWEWNPYGPGFTDHEGNTVPVTSEQDVFALVGLPYLQPSQR